MSMTNASTTVGAVRRSEGAHPRVDAARGRSPYQASTVTRSYGGVVRQIAESIRNRRISSGERLPTVRELSFAIGASRRLIREAIEVLGALGLVEACQGSGIDVRNNVPSVTRAFALAASPDATGRALTDHLVYNANAVTRNIPTSIPDAMVSHWSNAGVA